MFYLNITILCLVTILLVNQCLCVDPVLTPSTLTDNVTNSADADSTITWANLPAGKEYKTDATYDDGGMGPLFDFARSFINTAMPGGFPSALVSDLIKGSFDYMQILQSLAGYAACLVIGFLFIIIFTIVGCCFCCCRCCGNCGGKMIHRNTPSTSCRRKVYGVVLLVLIIFTTVGCICVFVSNDRMSTSIDKYGTTVTNNLDDITSYLDNTVAQIELLLITDLGFAFNVVDRDLDNIDVLVGIPVRNSLDALIGATALFNTIGALQTDVTTSITQFDIVDADLANFKSNLTTFNTELTNWITAYNADIVTCGATCSGLPTATGLTSNIDTNQIDISASKTEVDNIRNEDMNTLVDTARTEFKNIPERVKNESKTALTDINGAIATYKDEVKPIINSISDVQNSVNGSFNINDMKKQVNSYMALADPYDQYRWYGGVGLTCIILLVAVLQFIGLAFGVCGSSSDTLPTERGCLSHSGGNMLMASVGFIFIFSWLLMLLTTLSFALGAPMERYLCQSLSDPELKAISEILADAGIMKTKSGTGSWLGETLLKDSTIDLTLGGIITDCGDGKTAYTAFKLQYMSGFNLTTVTNYKQSIDIEAQLQGITVDFSTIEVAPQSLKDNMNNFKDSATSMNFSQYQTELSKNATGIDLGGFLTSLGSAITVLSTSAIKTSLETRATELQAIKDGSYANTVTAKNTLSSSMTTLEATFNGLPAKIDGLLADLTASETKLANDGSSVLNTNLMNFINRIFSIVDSLIDRAVNGIKNDIGKCTPVYNLYQSLIVIGLCNYMIDAFNGFWFSLGWCIFFFVPSTVFAVKLAKHFRKMTYLDEYDCTLTSKNQEPVYNGRNKVGHSDKF